MEAGKAGGEFFDYALEEAWTHEVGHSIRENAPKQYEELRRFMKSELYTAVSWENAVNMRREQYSKALSREISYEYAEEEVVCNSLGRMLGNV